MKEDLNFLELGVLARELSEKENSWVKKIYHPVDDVLMFHMYSSEHGKFMVKVHLPKYLTITEYKLENPMEPSHFVMFLRKYLNNCRLVDIKQPPAERVIELYFEGRGQKYILILEFFSKGNVILCDDKYEILIPLKSQKWKSRDIRPRKQYEYPPKKADLSDLDIANFIELIKDPNKNQLVKSVAVNLNLGGTYAEELCLRVGIDKKKPLEELTDSEFRRLLEAFNNLVGELKTKVKPNVVYENGVAIDVQPILLKQYEANEKKFFETYNEALDKFFTKKRVSKTTNKKKEEFSEEIEHQKKLLEQNKEYINELKKKQEEYKKKADQIYQHLGEIQDIVNTMLEENDRGTSWQEITEKIEQGKRAGNRSALLVKEIVPDRAKLILNVDSNAEIDFRKSVTDNANELYNKSKKMESKIPGVESQIRTIKERIESLEKRRQVVPDEVLIEEPKKEAEIEREWYEKFKWFFTSDGKLAIGGRSANQNEILIKKHLEPNDLVFHADVYGSPFVILKNGREHTEQDLIETANFTLCNSRAWQNKVPEAVYWVKPYQVTKEAPSGEYIGRGAFMIKGRKNYIDELELRYAVGVSTEPYRVVSGPPKNVRNKTRYYAVILPGDLSKDNLAKKIKEHILVMSREKDKKLIENISLEQLKEHCLKDSRIFGLIE